MIKSKEKADVENLSTVLESVLRILSQYFAIGGGLVLCGIVIVNSLSIAGRVFLDSPLTGDFELTEMGCAVAIFMFMPWCQMNKGNVIVDFFTSGLSDVRKHILDAIASFLFAVVVGLFTYRMTFGGLDMFAYGDQTMLLQIPVWIPFVPAVLSFALLFFVCLHTTYRSIRMSLGVR